MKSSTNKGQYSSMPPDYRCVWMSAGVLTYQLCNKEFDCDNCQLDETMRSLFARNKPPMSAESVEPSAHRIEEPSLMLYSRNHCWVRSVSDSTVRVGLEPVFASLLMSPKAVVLPTAGDRVDRDTNCFWVVLEGGTIPAKSPLGGTIRRTNASIAQSPHAVNTDPEGGGWLFELETPRTAIDAARLMSRKSAEEMYANDMNRFRHLLADEFRKTRKAVGVTMADGGELLSDIPAMLGVERFCELIRKVFG